MLTFIFVILMLAVFGRMIGLAVRMAWGVSRILLQIVFLPVTLVCLAVGGLLHLALFLLILAGVFSLFSSAL